MESKDILKTGTTTIGLKFKGGVILAADNRITTYKIESDSFCKLFDLSRNIVTTVAGHVAPAQMLVRYMKSEIKLMELKNERPSRVKEAAHLLSSIQYNIVRSQGAIVHSLFGGYDEKDGITLLDLAPDGSIVDCEDYYSSGSGSIFIKGILDTEYKSDMSEKEALELIHKCFRASFRNDTASGGGYNVKIVTKDGIKDMERKKVKSELVN